MQVSSESMCCMHKALDLTPVLHKPDGMCVPASLALRCWKHEDQQLKLVVGSIASSGPAWTTQYLPQTKQQQSENIFLKAAILKSSQCLNSKSLRQETLREVILFYLKKLFFQQ